jgi:hypothetical protein
MLLVVVQAASTAPGLRDVRAAAATATLQLTGTGVGPGLAVDVSANGAPLPGSPCDINETVNQGASCSYTVEQGQKVVLHPVVAAGFVGWSVLECPGTGDCSVDMDADRTVVATWTPTSLTVAVEGSDSPETVTTDDGKISCSLTGTGGSNQCTNETFDAFALVTLRAAGGPFDTWSGACQEAGNSPTCTLLLSGNDVVGAKFTDAQRDPQIVPPRQDVRLRVVIEPKGAGTVTSSRSRLMEAINCGSACSARFQQGENPRLSADAAPGARFVEWQGGNPYCTSNQTCRYPAFRTTSIKALFTAPPPPPPPDKTLTLTKAGRGTGTVSSSPAGISCGSTCAHAFKHGTAVTLTAVASARSRFAGWSGDCSGSGSCTLTMSANRSVIATFRVICVVPKVKGKRLRAAKRAIGKAHCSLGKVTRAFSESVKTGRVISQKPKPGKKLAAGSKVKLKLSKGKKT